MIVLDTNILVAAFYSRRGASNALLEGVLSGRISAAVSVALFLEYEDVLKRREISATSWASIEEIDSVLDALVSRMTLVSPIQFSLRPMLKDGNDEMVLECAMQANATAIVTLNAKDFGALMPWPGIEVVSPRIALQRFGREIEP